MKAWSLSNLVDGARSLEFPIRWDLFNGASALYGGVPYMKLGLICIVSCTSVNCRCPLLGVSVKRVSTV